jgi:hypothetical protein
VPERVEKASAFCIARRLSQQLGSCFQAFAWADCRNRQDGKRLAATELLFAVPTGYPFRGIGFYSRRAGTSVVFANGQILIPAALPRDAVRVEEGSSCIPLYAAG